MTQTGELLPVEQCDVDRLAYTVANAKLGEGPSVRCEGPTEFEVGIAREWVRRVLAALATRPNPSGAAAAGEDAGLASAVGYAAAVLEAHADKLPVPSHARALAARCREASYALASRPTKAGEDALREAAMAVLESAERPGSRAEYGIGPEGEVWHDYQEVSQKALDLLSAALASRKGEAEAAEGGVG